jgi:HSP20 family protein
MYKTLFFNTDFNGCFLSGSLDYSSSIPKSKIKPLDNGYKITLQVPGLTKDDLKMTIKDKNLVIEYDRKEDDDRFIDGFKKIYRLVNEIDIKKISAKVENGMLEIDLPFDETKVTDLTIQIS